MTELLQSVPMEQTRVGTRRLRIAHLFQSSHTDFSEPRAAHLHIYHTLRGLQGAGHEASLLALHGREVLFTDDLSLFEGAPLSREHFGRLGSSGAHAFKRAESAVRFLQVASDMPYLALFDSYRMRDACLQNAANVDLLHERFNLLSVGGILASRRLGIPLVLEVNADLIEQRRAKGVPERGLRLLWARLATRLTLAGAASVVCVSEELRLHLQQKWKLPAQKLVTLPCAADVEAFGQPFDTRRMRQLFQLTDEPVVAWVGGFYEWHDLDLLVASFARLVEHVPRARLLLVGDGPTRRSVVQNLGSRALLGKVILTGSVSHSEVPGLLSIADVVLAPAAPLTAYDGGTGTPLKLFEYMAAGKAIVATAMPHAVAVIEEGETGLLIAPGDVGGFADAMARLIRNPDERARLGRNARERAREQHGWEQYTERLEAIYRRVLGEQEESA